MKTPPTSFSKYVTVNDKGEYEVSLDFFKKTSYNGNPEYWKKEFEKVLNGPQLYECNRCGILDTKEQLDKGVEHGRIECEIESYRRRVYDGVSLKCKLFPWLFEDELKKVKKSIRFQDGNLYSYNHVLRKESAKFIHTFYIPEYESKENVVPEDKWWFNKKYF